MRILQIAALFTTLFIARGGCRPDTSSDYPADDGDEYPEIDETNEPDNRGEQGANTPSAHINTVPLKLLVRIGDTVYLPCNATNTQDVVVIWQRGATPLYHDQFPDVTGDDARRILRQSNNTLMIKNFMESDVSDNYTCHITSEPPEKVEHSVRTSKHLFVLPSDRVEVNEPNKTVHLACQANWEPKPMIKWFHDGERVNSDEFPKDGSSLTVHNVTESNAGLYQCLVEEDPTIKPELHPIYVLAHHAPKIEVDTEIVHTGIHLESELTCRVDAYPYAQVTWFKDGKKVAVGRQDKTLLPNQKTKHTLVLSLTEKSDFGNYTCEATNSVGKAKRFIVLTGTPREATFVKVDTSADGTIPILEWVVQSNAPILRYELEYRREGDKDWQIASPGASDDGTSNTFTVRHPLDGLKAGKYEAVLLAQNEFGWSPRPSVSATFIGENITAEPDLAGSKSGAASTRSLLLSRSLLILGSILVYTTYL